MIQRGGPFLSKNHKNITTFAVAEKELCVYQTMQYHGVPGAGSEI
jgi:hypothetical protein